MLIESGHPSGHSSTPPLNQSVMSSSPSPQTAGYDMIERLNSRVNGYRDHHKMCFLKNETTVETQNAKMKTETLRLQHQFLNNNHNNNTANNKSKQHKAVNASAAQRNANKRSNSAANQCDPKCDTTEAKPTKVPKVANSRLNGANNTAKASGLSPSAHFGRNCVKFNPQSNQLDVKMKPSIGKSCMTTTTANTSQPMSANTCGPEIKREIEDNSYFESVNVDAIHDILSNSCSTASAVSNGCGANGMEMIGSDVMRDLFSDSGLADDGLGGANFGDEDFIAKFLEDLNESSFNDMANSFGQQMNPQMKPLNAQQLQQLPQQMINHSNNTNAGNNEGINCNLNVNAMNNNSNNANLILTTNQMNFNTNQLQTNSEMSSSYHPIPIQPRLQPNLIANIANRPTLHMITNNQNFTTNTVNNSNNVRNYVNVVNTGPQPQQQLLLQQITPHLTQQSLNNVNVQIQQQPQSGPAIHSRLPVNTVPRMVSVVPKPENVSVQLSIQVPQQTANANPMSSQIAQQTSGHASQAAAKLKQMAQHVQQKTHNWVVNHSNASLSQMPQQMPQQSQQSQQQMTQSPQRLAQQPQQQRQVLVINDTQNQNQTQTYFTPQMNQQIYWQQSQQQTQQQPQQHIQNHSQPQQQIIQQNQQSFDNYWSHPQQMGQIVGQPSQQTPQQPQQPPQQPTQQLYNNYNNNYNYF